MQIGGYSDEELWSMQWKGTLESTNLVLRVNYGIQMIPDPE